eukprot:TRINITY_DN78_c0_g1_i7.p1 TRINITY_DN78_c0_g1~~TRINITY_DN78_c0_g1_i7.p1  ORF type:complete len:154 (+),score=9.13 TRINITY_DN78_c0_g1_i7:152-613(+)
MVVDIKGIDELDFQGTAYYPTGLLVCSCIGDEDYIKSYTKLKSLGFEALGSAQCRPLPQASILKLLPTIPGTGLACSIRNNYFYSVWKHAKTELPSGIALKWKALWAECTVEPILYKTNSETVLAGPSDIITELASWPVCGLTCLKTIISLYV